MPGSSYKGRRATAIPARAYRRRAFLKGGAVAGALMASPAIVRDAFSSSGELNWFTSQGFAPKILTDRFTKDTGVKVNVTEFASNDEQVVSLHAARGVGFDLCTPTIAWVAALHDLSLIQPVDERRLGNLGNMHQTFFNRMDDLGGRAGGKLIALPYCWSTEAIAFNTAVVKIDHPTASYGDLWNPAHQGKMTCRPRTLLLSTGLWMEGEGRLPKGTMFKAYMDADAFKLGYGSAVAFAIKNRAQIGMLWGNMDDVGAAFTTGGCVIGQTWDTPIEKMAKAGHPLRYLAPKEGALTTLDCLALPRGAKNIEQAYAFANWALQPRIGGMLARETGYHSVVAGAEKFAAPDYARNFNSAYPGDSISRLWFEGQESDDFFLNVMALLDGFAAP